MAGVTEPAIYGVNLRLKKPLIGVVCGAFAGGVVARLMGATAYVYGYSTILAVPIFQDTIIAILVAIAVAIAVAAAVAFMIGFNEAEVVDEEEEAPAADTAAADADVNDSNADDSGNASAANASDANEDAAVSVGPAEIFAPLTGTVVPRDQIPDETFATGVLGDGVGIEPEIGEVVAPFDGMVSSTAETLHAVGLSGPGGIELLIHVGVDTVNLQGEGFKLYVKEGDKVAKGQKLITFDIAKIKAAGYHTTTAVLVTNSDDCASFKVNACGRVLAGSSLITIG